MRLLRRIDRARGGLDTALPLAEPGLGRQAFIAAVAVLGVSIAGIAPLIRIQFFPDDYNLYYVFIEGPADTPIETVDERVRAIARAILADGPAYARSAAGYAGFVLDENDERDAGHHLGTVMVTLPATERARVLRPGRTSGDGQAADGRAVSTRRLSHQRARSKDGPQSGKAINLRIVGHDEDAVAGLADALVEGAHR